MKEYSTFGVATDANGEKHMVTVVGRFKRYREKRQENQPFRKIVRELTLGYSICHPDDEFNQEIGENIAKRRLVKQPIGTVKSYDITMLDSITCDLLVKNELSHIVKNIDKYIKK